MPIKGTIVLQVSPFGHPEVVQSDKHLLLSHYSDVHSQSRTNHTPDAFVKRAVSFAIGLSRGCTVQDGGGQGLWEPHRSLQLSQNIVKMSVHQDSRMYEAKEPEVDDVVMVQVRGAAAAPAMVCSSWPCIPVIQCSSTSSSTIWYKCLP